MEKLDLNLEKIETTILDLMKKKNKQYIEIMDLDDRLNKYEILYLVVNSPKLNKIVLLDIDTKQLFKISDVVVPYFKIKKLN